MNRQSPWLFEMPPAQPSSYYANLEYETPLENEWEITAGNYYNVPSAEDEWEANPSKRPLKQTARIPQRRPAMPRRQQRHAPVGQRQFRQTVSAPQSQGIGAERTLVATIDGFETGSYLLKRRQFEQLATLIAAIQSKSKEAAERSKPKKDKVFLPRLKLFFVGHTDSVGEGSASNELLGFRRAMEVESFIKRSFKTAAPNLPTTADSKASEISVSPKSNQTARGREANRRVQVFSNIPI